ncbi:MAG TPA: hypothetical protein VMX76_02815 [Nevskiaceae bacterium]|nr:hypothetical protein [Nevskiaceae bacterium]
MGKVKINWLEAFQDYLSDEKITLNEIAKKYGVSLSRVKKVSMIRKWKQTKDGIWEKARETAIEETVGSTKELIKRHSETARYLQKVGIDGLKAYFKTRKPSELKTSLLLRMIVLGLKTERKLYPEESIIRYFRMKPRTDDRLAEVSPELIEAVHEVLSENITQSPHAKKVANPHL